MLLPILFVAFSLDACDEQLPEYKDPRDVFTARMDAYYAYGPSENSLKIFLVLKNTFDETLSAEADIQGYIEISLARDLTFKRRFALTSADLISPKNYDPVTKIFTLDPGDSVRFRVSWDFIDQSGRDLKLSVFRYTNDPSCAARKIASPETFILRGQIKIYNRIGFTNAASTLYRLCHIMGWQDRCPLFNMEIPCSYWPPPSS